jgi:hypothetical protein
MAGATLVMIGSRSLSPRNPITWPARTAPPTRASAVRRNAGGAAPSSVPGVSSLNPA